MRRLRRLRRRSRASSVRGRRRRVRVRRRRPTEDVIGRRMRATKTAHGFNTSSVRPNCPNMVLCHMDEGINNHTWYYFEQYARTGRCVAQNHDGIGRRGARCTPPPPPPPHRCARAPPTHPCASLRRRRRPPRRRPPRCRPWRSFERAKRGAVAAPGARLARVSRVAWRAPGRRRRPRASAVVISTAPAQARRSMPTVRRT